MPCGCSGNSAEPTKKEWTFVNAKGEQTTFRTEIEARAAQVRAGGSGTIK
jgi:hypothetical protein